MSSDLIPPETEIKKAINRLKKAPGEFQRLCEMYVKLRYPERFKRIVPYGRRDDDVAIKGWPDAFAPIEGGIEALEVTHSPDWTSHISDDIKKTKKFRGEAIKGFLFISWFDNPRSNTIKRYKEELASLDLIPENNITFVFANELVSDLHSSGRYTRILSEILKLPCNPYPFRPVDKVEYLYGKDDKKELPAPTLREYLDGLVHRPAIADEVVKRLLERNWVILRGRGASGKTSLALQIAHSERFNEITDDTIEERFSTVYYLDIGTTEGDKNQFDVKDVFEAITHFTDDGVLFILDNIHLGEATANIIFEHWENAPRKSRLLMLGREITKAPHIKGGREPLDKGIFTDNTLILQIDKEDLWGVYERLAKRKMDDVSKIQKPSPDRLAKWHKLFGGSLIIFSAAVVNKLDSLIKGNWKLTHKDAEKTVRRLYLNPLKTEPTQKKDLLRIAAMAKWELSTPEDALDDQDEPVKHAIKNGIVHGVEARSKNITIYRMIHAGIGELILAAAKIDSSEEMGILIDITGSNPGYGLSISWRLENAGEIENAKAILREIAKGPESFITVLLTPNLTHAYVNILSFNRLGLITYCETDKYVSKDRTKLIKSALDTSIERLTHFLIFATKNKMTEVYKCIIQNFEKTDGKGELIHKKQLINTALTSPPEDLTYFLKFAITKMPKVFETLVNSLNRSEHRDKLIGNMSKTRLDNLTVLLNYIKDEIGQIDLGRILKGIEITEWKNARVTLEVDKLDSIKNFADIVCMYKRPELAEAPARNIILKTQSREQHSEQIHLHHISNTLKFGRNVENKEITRFLNIIATDDWLDGQYKSPYTKPGSIAGFLYSIWAFNEDNILTHFKTRSLKSRFEFDVRRFHLPKSVEDLSGKTQLIGIAALIGLKTPEEILKLPETDLLIKALDCPSPLRELERLGYTAVQFWLGLRELARLRPGEITVPANVGDKILELWQEAEPEVERHETLNAQMIPWLEKCQANGWQLVKAPRINIP